MEVIVSLSSENTNVNLKNIAQCYSDYYKKGLVCFNKEADENGFMSALKKSGKDDMEISVCGNDERIVLISRFDNLGKGASGSAIQNMNIVLGLDEKEGLNL